MSPTRPIPTHPNSVRCDIRTQWSSDRLVSAREEEVARIAERQWGVVSRGQLRELGLSPDQIGRRIRSGYLRTVHRGVYAVGHRVLTFEGKWLAAALACGSGAALSHRSAAELWGVMSRRERVIDVASPRLWRPKAGLAIHQTKLLPDELGIISDIPVTGLARTFLDLAAVLSRSGLEQALNEAEVLGLTDRLSIPDLLERYPRRPGTRVLRCFLAEEREARGITRRELEARFKRLLDRSHLPRPRLNADIWVGGRFFNVDCLWVEQRVIVELDGRAVHGTRQAFERDREKDRMLQAEGWRVVRVTWRQLRGDARAVIADLRRTLKLAAPPTL